MSTQEKNMAQLIDEISALREQLAGLEAREAQHQQTAARYKTLIEQLPAITYVVSMDGVHHTSYISPQVERLLGFSPEEWLADPDLWIRQIYPEDRDQVLAEVKHSDANGNGFDLEYRVLTRDGSVRWIYNQYRRVAGQRLQDLHGVMFDITDQKLAEGLLLRQNRYLAVLHETALMLNGQFDLPELLRSLMERVGQLLETPHGFIYLSAENETKPELQVGLGLFFGQAGLEIDFIKAVWQSGQPLVITDYETWPQRNPAGLSPLVQTVLCLPLSQNVGAGSEETLLLKGVFGLAYEKCQPVSTEEIELLSRFAELASLAINNAWLLEEATEARCQAEDQAKNLATINRINQIISDSPDLTAALSLVTREIAQIFEVHYTRIALLTADRAGMKFVADYSQDPTALSAIGMVIPLGNNPISGQVVKTGRPLVVQPAELALQIQTRTESIYSILKAKNVQCLMIIPLLVSGEVVGIIGLESTDSERVFSPADLRLADTIAGQIAGMIDKARLLKEAQEQRRLAESLHQVAAVLNASLDIETVLNSFLQQLGQVVHFDSAAILLHQGDDLVVVSVIGWLNPENVIDQAIPLSSGSPAVRVFQGRSPLIIDDVQQDPGWIDLPDTQHIHGWMGIPLLTGERVLGVLEVSRLTAGGYGPTEAQVGQTFANQATTALENARLYRHVTDRTKELSHALEELKSAQHQLVESEKMASLGGLVAGIAHEINTPIGIGVTAASTLEDETGRFLVSYQKGGLKRSELDVYLNTAQESSRLILNNLQRAAELVQSFKQVAVDQTNLERRKFGVKTYIDDVLRSLTPQLKRSPHHLSVIGADDLVIDSYPGALSQVVTNLVMNSVLHAYPDDKGGQLIFELRSEGKQIIIEYRDDGCGIAPEDLKKIYEPFFTTARHRGGTGLGLHIVYNLVIQKLGGQINCESVVGQGTKFTLTLPMHL